MTTLNLKFYGGFDLYSDGDIENEILDIVKSHKDFTDILRSDNRWPVMYHFSPFRRNLLEWYDFDPTGSLLEIGGGCGAFSGMFAEKLREVKVVELSKRRAQIICERHNQYNNLEVIVGNLNDIEFHIQFDYITLIGVLEYAGRFTNSEKPFKALLELVIKHLKPSGKLFVAIENKYGLKYFAGAKEDHTGRFFDGIEDYPSDKLIQTFGKNELRELLISVGLQELAFYYPMPDYKLPKIIYSDAYLPDETAFFDSYSPNFDQERYQFFNENLAYIGIIKNKMFDFFANSFLLVAGR
jgi:SAM-dependent methyltransferase